MSNGGLNVLSLFDGMSCGRIALERAGVKVNKYYASEIDKHAIAVARHNWPDTIHIGDVTKVDPKDLPKIDLMIMGSPCQGFSYLGDVLAFDDPRSSLFFEVIRLKSALNPQWWMLENVRMAKKHIEVIDGYMGVEAMAINSNLVAAQSRPRLYWSNIPDIKIIPNPTSPLEIIDHSDQSEASESWQKWWERKGEFQLKKQYSCILNDAPHGVCQIARQFANWNGSLVRNDAGRLRFANRLECERMQTVPEGYTSTASKAQAYKMLGNGWTVDIIAQIFRGLAT